MVNLNGSMEITTVIGCKVCCKGCPQGRLVKRYTQKNGRSSKSFTVEDFKECVNKIPATVLIIFSGMAEPWLNENCTEMLLYAAKKGHRIAVRTTLVGMSGRDFSKIKDLDEIEDFVIQVPDASKYCNISVTTGYLRLMSDIINTPHKVRDRLSFLCQGKALHPEVSPLINAGGFSCHFVSHDPNGDAEQLCGEQDPGTGRIECSLSGRAMNRNVLLPDGTVLLCVMDFGMEHMLGNLIEMTYNSLFKNPDARRILKAFDNETSESLCRRCPCAQKTKSRVPYKRRGMK